MLSAANFYWYVPTDVHVEYPRCNWSYQDWVNNVCKTFTKTVRKVWDYANDDSIVKTSLDDDTSMDKIFRFVNMDQKYIIDLRKKLQSCGCQIKISGHEIWEGIQIGKALVRDGKERQSGNLQKMLDRAATDILKWNRVTANAEFNGFVRQFVTGHDRSLQLPTFLRDPNNLPQLPVVDANKVYATNIDIDSWSSLPWQQLQGTTILAPELAIYLSLELPFGNQLWKESKFCTNSSVKDSSLDAYSTEDICVLYTPSEIESVIDYNAQQQVQQTQIVQLQSKTKHVNELYGKVQVQRAALSSLNNFDQYKNKFILILRENENKDGDGYNKLFSFFQSKESIIQVLDQLLFQLTLLKVCMSDVSNVVNQFVVAYKDIPRVPDEVKTPEEIRKKKQKTKELGKYFQKLTMDCYEKSKKCHQYSQDSQLTPFVPFLLSSLWSANYCENAQLNLKIALTDIQWTNVPVSNREVILWYDQICGSIEVLATGKFMCNKWYKYWQFDGYKFSAYEQILEHKCQHIRGVLSKLS